MMKALSIVRAFVSVTYLHVDFIWVSDIFAWDFFLNVQRSK